MLHFIILKLKKNALIIILSHLLSYYYLWIMDEKIKIISKSIIFKFTLETKILFKENKIKQMSKIIILFRSITKKNYHYLEKI